MNAHLAHASVTRLMEHIELLPSANVRKRARRLWVRSIEKDWVDDQLAALLRQLVARLQASSLSRANGQGSAGHSPASLCAKKPAAGEWVHRDAATNDSKTNESAVDASSHVNLYWPGEGVV